VINKANIYNLVQLIDCRSFLLYQ